MTLKISSATVKFERNKRTFHIWWACKCVRWAEHWKASWSDYSFLHFTGIVRDINNSFGQLQNLLELEICEPVPISLGHLLYHQ